MAWTTFEHAIGLLFFLTLHRIHLFCIPPVCPRSCRGFYHTWMDCLLSVFVFFNINSMSGLFFFSFLHLNCVNANSLFNAALIQYTQKEKLVKMLHNDATAMITNKSNWMSCVKSSLKQLIYWHISLSLAMKYYNWTTAMSNLFTTTLNIAWKMFLFSLMFSFFYLS